MQAIVSACKKPSLNPPAPANKSINVGILFPPHPYTVYKRSSHRGWLFCVPYIITELAQNVQENMRRIKKAHKGSKKDLQYTIQGYILSL